MNKLAVLILSVFSMALTFYGFDGKAETKQLNKCRLHSYNLGSEDYLIEQVGDVVQASLNVTDATTANVVVNGLVPYTTQGMTSRIVTVLKEGASKVTLADIVQNKDVLSQILTELTENNKGVAQAIQNFSIENHCK